MSIKQHSIAAIVSAAVSASAIQVMPAKVIVSHPVSVNASKHAWPDLADAEKAILADRVRGDRFSVMIFCEGADCTDLQTDLDDAFEDAGVKSQRAVPFAPLGYGMAIYYAAGEYELASKLAKDIRVASAGRLQPQPALNTYSKAGELKIAIGKRPRS